MNIVISRFNPENGNFSEICQQIYEILNNCYGQSPWSESYILSNLSTDEYFLAYYDDELVGFLSVQSVLDEMEITNIAVKLDFQGKQIATTLMSQIQNFAGTIFLEVRESNQAAQHLYKKQGFEQFHVRKNYYTAPTEDAILMRKENG